MDYCNEAQTMTPDEFAHALAALGWKQSDFCRMAGVNKSTPSRWMTGEQPIPAWVPKYLGLTVEIARLHDAYVVPPKASAGQQK